MLALVEYRASLCPNCHGDLAETTAHELWDVPPPIRCHKCTHIAVAQENHTGKQLSALRWGAKRRG
jgi:uncharacterized protein with PIN domain